MRRSNRKESTTGNVYNVNPLSPNIKVHILLSVPHIFSYGTSWENLMRQQDISSWVIIFFILMT